MITELSVLKIKQLRKFEKIKKDDTSNVGQDIRVGISREDYQNPVSVNAIIIGHVNFKHLADERFAADVENTQRNHYAGLVNGTKVTEIHISGAVV